MLPPTTHPQHLQIHGEGCDSLQYPRTATDSNACVQRDVAGVFIRGISGIRGVSKGREYLIKLMQLEKKMGAQRTFYRQLENGMRVVGCSPTFTRMHSYLLGIKVLGFKKVK